MKANLKIWILAFFGILFMGTTAMADDGKPVTVNSLPVAARQIITKHFSAKKVALAKKESGLVSRSYDVVFTDGSKIEFDKKGAWTEISSRRSAVPSALVPAAIRNYVKGHYNGNNIVKIERDGSKYEVGLSNGLELTFNNKFQLIDVDN